MIAIAASAPAKGGGGPSPRHNTTKGRGMQIVRVIAVAVEIAGHSGAHAVAGRVSFDETGTAPTGDVQRRYS